MRDQKTRAQLPKMADKYDLLAAKAEDQQRESEKPWRKGKPRRWWRSS